MKFLPFALIGAAFTHALSTSWLKWGNILVDSGREFDLPRRMLEGEHLYRDLRFYYGPLAPVVNTMLYGTFGVHAQTLIVAGLCTVLLTSAGIYRILRLFINRTSSSFVVVLFLYVCAFGHVDGNAVFNFVVPYTYSATYGMLSAVWCLYFLLRYQQRSRESDLWFSGGLLVLASLSKLETLLPVVAVHALAFGLNAFDGKGRTRRHALVLATAATVIAAVLGILTLQIGVTLWRDNLAALFNAGSTPYVRSILGLQDPSLTLTGIAVSLVIVLVTLLIGHVAALLARPPLPTPMKWGIAAVTAAAAYAVYSVLPFTLHFAALPLIACAALFGSLYLCFRDARERDRWSMHALVWMFVIASVARIFFSVGAYRYGFYLIPVGLAALSLVYIDYLPRLVPGNLWAFRTAAASGLAVMHVIGSAHWTQSVRQFADHRYEIATNRGRLLLNSSFVPPVLNALARYPPQTRVLVIPQGAGLIFFSGLQAADGMFSYLPMEFSGSYSDHGVLIRWQANPPDVVVWYHSDLREFGYTEFGAEYAQQSAMWLRQNYQQVPGNAVLFERRH
jgi:hypothetical protein